MVLMMNLPAGQQQRHRHRNQKCGDRREKKGEGERGQNWRDQHGNIYAAICKLDRQWEICQGRKLAQCSDNPEEGWGGRWEGALRSEATYVTPVADSC